MKRIFIVLFLLAGLFSCKENNSQTADSNVQRDTVKTNKLLEQRSDETIQNGEYIQYYKNGVTKMRGMMKDGKRDGLWKSFYENGSPWSETTFRNGMKDGRTTTWYENEKKRYEGFYSADKESGHWKFWDEKGNLVTEEDYDKKKE
jgi:antitoxin component YwqK of YwqJK toxin-antitoxin module